jgi:hypothetical protein
MICGLRVGDWRVVCEIGKNVIINELPLHKRTGYRIGTFAPRGGEFTLRNIKKV